MSERCYTYEHGGAKILMVNYSGLDADAILKLVAESDQAVADAGTGGQRLLIDMTDSKMNSAASDAMRESRTKSKGLVAKVAVVGAQSGLVRIIANVLSGIGGINTRLCLTVDEANAWLAA
jgi:hypothetical protein